MSQKHFSCPELAPKPACNVSGHLQSRTEVTSEDFCFGGNMHALHAKNGIAANKIARGFELFMQTPRR